MIPKIIHYCWFGGKNYLTNYKNTLMNGKVYIPISKL